VKAVIIEIHKDYCIVMTKDGQFLKRKIPAGVFEIGDEIMVSEKHSHQPEAARVNWVKNFAVAAIVVVMIAAGSIWLVKYMKMYYSSRNMRLFTQDEAVGEMKVEAELEEEAPAEEDAQESALAMDEEQKETVVYKGMFSIEEGLQIDEEISGIMFSYQVIDGTSMYVRLENISRSPYFNGTFEISTLLSDESVSRSLKTILLQGFKPEQVRENTFILKAGEVNFWLQVTERNY